jgi:hypothetical protein
VCSMDASISKQSGTYVDADADDVTDALVFFDDVIHTSRSA